MEQGVVLITDDNYKFLALKNLDYILNNEKKISKRKIVEICRNLRDELDRF